MRISEWFPSDIKPVHIGWYHTKTQDGRESQFNWWWNGDKWSDFQYGYECQLQERVWRGLINEKSSDD